jgi:hypothetical protein
MVIWRYGIMKNGSDLTDLDQWMSWRNVPTNAPAALFEAITRFIEVLDAKQAIQGKVSFDFQKFLDKRKVK